MSKCILCGRELTTADYYLVCGECNQKNLQPAIPMQGWVCPRCGKVHSPYSMECNCTPPMRVWTGSSTELNESEK